MQTEIDGVTFTRSQWGTWYGTDGSNVDDDYIEAALERYYA